MLKANIHHSTLSAQHWHLAVPHSVDVHNYTLHSHHPYKTPHELMWGSKPDIRYMHPFGCIGYQDAKDQLAVLDILVNVVDIYTKVLYLEHTAYFLKMAR